jgi:hypothetical protein
VPQRNSSEPITTVISSDTRSRVATSNRAGATGRPACAPRAIPAEGGGSDTTSLRSATLYDKLRTVITNHSDVKKRSPQRVEGVSPSNTSHNCYGNQQFSIRAGVGPTLTNR